MIGAERWWLDLTGARFEPPLTGLTLDLGDAVIEGSIFLIDDQSGRRPLVRDRGDRPAAAAGLA